MLWLCIGDYNEILTFEEKQGRIPRPSQLMEILRSVYIQCGLVDLGYRGNKFTWRNGRHGEAFAQERLDRARATIEWRTLFPNNKVFHLQAYHSNYDPIMLTTNAEAQVARRKKKYLRGLKRNGQCIWNVSE